MPTDSSVAVTAGTGPSIDTELVTTGVGTVNRQVVAVGDASDGAKHLVINASGEAAISLADGSSVTLGSKSDAANTDNTSSWSIRAMLGGIWGRLRGGQATMANSLPVAIASDQSAFPVNLPDATATGALGALNNTVQVALSGLDGASVGIAGTGTLVGTVVPEVSLDGGTTWVASSFVAPVNGALSTSTVVASGQSAIQFGILIPSGASHARVRVSAYTSGTVNATVRATTNAFQFILDAAGNLKVAVATALPAGANVIGGVTQSGGPWTENTTQLGGTAIDTNSGNKSAGTQRIVIATDQPALTNALKVDGSAVTQPVSGTVTANAGTGTFSIGTPAAAALSDTISNPTTVLVGAANLLWDAANTEWRRWKSANNIGEGESGALIAASAQVLMDQAGAFHPARVITTGATSAPYNGVQAVGSLTSYTTQVGWTLAGTGITHTTAATADNVVPNQTDTSTKRRFLWVKWTGNQAIHLVLLLTSGSGNAVGTLFGFDLTINAGNTNTQSFLISSDGVFANDANSTVNALTSGSLKTLDFPATTLSIRAYAAVTPASGTLSLDMVMQT